MIGLIFTGKCKDCEHADLDIECYESGLGQMRYEVRCKHDEACNRIEELMIKEEPE